MPNSLISDLNEITVGFPLKPETKQIDNFSSKLIVKYGENTKALSIFPNSSFQTELVNREPARNVFINKGGGGNGCEESTYDQLCRCAILDRSNVVHAYNTPPKVPFFGTVNAPQKRMFNPFRSDDSDLFMI